MWKYILNRLVQILVTLVIFFALTYIILDAQPGDITLQYLGNPKFTQEQKEALQERLGLNKPVLERFGQWFLNTIQGDLGDSYKYRKPVTEIIAERAPRTIFLFLTATLIEFFIGYYLGKVLAWTRGSVVEYSITVVGAIMFTIFTPWFALMMIWLFGFTLKWAPIGKFLDPNIWRKVTDDTITSNGVFNQLLLTMIILIAGIGVIYFFTRKMNPNKSKWLRLELVAVLIAVVIGVWAQYQYAYLAVDIIRHMVLPIFVLTAINFSGTMLLTRTTMLETLREDYIMAARAKGISENDVRDNHAARNAFLPVFTNLVISLPFIIGGGIITETVFSWPGMGLTLLEASIGGDIPMVMGAFMFIGVLALLAHLVADIMYVFLDPRIRYA